MSGSVTAAVSLTQGQVQSSLQLSILLIAGAGSAEEESATSARLIHQQRRGVNLLTKHQLKSGLQQCITLCKAQISERMQLFVGGGDRQQAGRRGPLAEDNHTTKRQHNMRSVRNLLNRQTWRSTVLHMTQEGTPSSARIETQLRGHTCLLWIPQQFF